MDITKFTALKVNKIPESDLVFCVEVYFVHLCRIISVGNCVLTVNFLRVLNCASLVSVLLL